MVPSVTGTALSDYSVTVQNGVLTITPAGTTITIGTSSASITPGQSVMLTADVTSVTTGTPTGSVSFYDGTTLLGTAPVTAGAATLSTSAFVPGSSNTLQAVYSGVSTSLPPSSTATVTVSPLDFTLTIPGSASQTITRGSSATYQVMVTPLYGNYPGPVSFSASGLPTGASASFSPSTIGSTAGIQTVTLTVQTTQVAKETAPSIGRKLAPIALALFLIPLFGTKRLRRQGGRLSKLACLLLLLGSTLVGAMVTGCGGGSIADIEQFFTITVTSTSGNVQHTAPVTLTIK